MTDSLVLKHAPAPRGSSKWPDDDYDVLCDGEIVGRIYRAFNTSPGGKTWTVAYGHHRDRSPAHGYEATCEDAMAVFAKSWPREG